MLLTHQITTASPNQSPQQDRQIFVNTYPETNAFESQTSKRYISKRVPDQKVSGPLGQQGARPGLLGTQYSLQPVNAVEMRNVNFAVI